MRPAPRVETTEQVSAWTHFGSDYVRVYPPSPHEASPPFTLPPNLSTFTGRQQLLDRLDELLRPGGPTTLSLVSADERSGIGKSALAIHAARRWHARFPAGVIWIDMQGKRGACSVLRHIAGLYGYHDQAAQIGERPQTLAGLVRAILRDKRVLLILDNAEECSAEELDHLLPGVPGPVIMVTSRRASPALARLGPPLRVDAMGLEEALALLGQLVDVEKVEAQAEPYHRLARRLGHLPLALDIGGRCMHARGWDAAEMRQWLEKAAGSSTFSALPAVERPEEGISLAFALSYDGLNRADQAFLQALSTFAPSGFTPQAAAAVAGRHDQTKEPLRFPSRWKDVRIVTALKQLEGLALVRRTTCFIDKPEGAEGLRYALHPLLRQYGRALAQQAGEWDHWATRHARYFTRLANWGGRQLTSPETASQAVATVIAERANLLVAQEHCLAQGLWDEAVSLAYDLDDLFERSGHQADRRRVLERGLEAARQGEDRRGEADLAHNLGILAQARGDVAEARRLYKQAAEVFEQLGAQREEATVLHNLGGLVQRQEDYNEGHRVYRKALEIMQALGDRTGAAQALYQLGRMAQYQGAAAEACRFYQESLEIVQQLGDQARVAQALHQMGRLAQEQRDLGGARQLYRESLGISQHLDDQSSAAQTLHQLGVLAQARGDIAQAHRRYHQALDIRRQLGDQAGAAQTLQQLGILAQMEGDADEARRLFHKSLELSQQLGDQAGVARSLHQLGMLAQAQGNASEAQRLYEESLGIKRQLDDRAGIAKTLHQLGILAQAQGKAIEARRFYQETIDVERQIGNQAGLASTLHSLGMMVEEDGDLEAAERLFAESLAVLETLGLPNGTIARESLERVQGRLAKAQGPEEAGANREMNTH
jgi:tetratricopeptide (TPR) repeat protein